MAQKPYVAMLPSPGMGHLIPLAEFAKQLVLHHHFSVTIIVPTTGPPPSAQKDILEALPEDINYVFLPPVCFEDLPEGGASPETQVTLTVTRSLSSIRDLFKSLIVTNIKPVALVVDLFGTDAFDVAMEFNVPSYLYFLSPAMALSFIFYLPKLDEMVSCEYRDLPEPVKIPGCRILFDGRDLPDPVQDRKSDAYRWLLHHTGRYSLAEGILVNGFVDLEAETIKYLQEEEPGKPPIYPIGPLIQTGSNTGADGSKCLEWLDNQPKGSVVFVSFGSGGTLSLDQLHELALGLEMSGQKFLWVLRSPNDKSANASYFSLQSKTDPFVFLPKGFLDRTKGQGLVVPSWAPQIQVLSHGSTGGFLTHCGWNSVLESVVHGVPLIAWPLYAEQKINAVLLTENLKVALRPKANENGIVGREEIAKVVKVLFQGEDGVMIREQMNKLKDAAAKAISEDGSSTKTLHKLLLKWKNHST